MEQIIADTCRLSFVVVVCGQTEKPGRKFLSLSPEVKNLPKTIPGFSDLGVPPEAGQQASGLMSQSVRWLVILTKSLASGVALSVASPRHAKRQAWLWAFHYNRSRSNRFVSIYKKNRRNK
ncbi:MAG: hypothetical protein PSX36_14465 [bacterium]|nr:hypothetical protein [bacterium]